MRFRSVSATAASVLLIAIVLLTWTPTGTAQQADDRLPVPDSDAQAKSLELVRDLYKEKFDRAVTRSQKADLAAKLIDQALATREDPAGRYVLLSVARQIAVDARDVARAFGAIDEMARSYQVDAGELKSAALVTMAESAKRKIENQHLAAGALEAIDGAVEADEYALADELAEVALRAARTARDGKLVREVAAKKDELEEAQRAYAAVQDVLATLRDRPDDPDANLTAGSYYCFRRRDWARGIPLLAAGSDPGLSALAQQDLGGATSPSAMAELADRWFQAAQRAPGAQKAAMLARAVHWYQRALPGLSGLTKQKVERQLAKASESSGSTEQAVADRSVFKMPQNVISADAHEGESGRFSANNVYTFAAPRPVRLDQTAIFYQAQGAAGHDTNGKILFSLGGDNWIPFGQWTPEEMKAGASRGNWHRADFSSLEKEVRTGRILIKFDYTSGAQKLTILRALWAYEGK